MAGLVFMVSIPCEGYEKLLVKEVLWDKNKEVQQISSDEDETNNFKNSKESKQQSIQSVDTCAVSIDSDSLNLNERKREREPSIGERKLKKRTKSYDDLSSGKIRDECSQENLGSMDSDRFTRMMKDRARIRANEEAIDKFFNVKLSEPQIDETSSMEKVLRQIISKIRITNSSWQRVNNGNSYQVTFSLENGVRCDETIHMLSEFGIGQREGSSIVIIPCTMYSDHNRVRDADEETSSSQATGKETGWNKFISTIRARMNVAKIVEAVKSDATITFDFTIVLIVASVIASFGLIENSTLFLAASMLISPLMGPILAATFGAVIKDHKLQYWGIKNEVIGIFMCILVGFFFGLIVCGLSYRIGDTNELPSEMIARTQLRSLIVGICIALPSGAAVAIAILGENFGSLVGVAISASLLPPAVNTGLLWSFSCIHMIFKNTVPRFQSIVKGNSYSDTEALELLAMGCVSLCVTLTNVLCIYMMGFIFLKIKEVVPVSDNQRQFWKHDIKIARDYNKTLNAEEGIKLQKDAAQFEETCDNFKGVGAELLKQRHYTHTNTWSPLSFRHHRKEAYNTRTSLRELEALYMSFSGKNVAGEKHHRHFPFTKNSSPPHEKLSDQSRGKNPLNAPRNSLPEYGVSSTAPLEAITETPRRIAHETTLVSIDGPCQPGPSGLAKKKFTVTPAHDPLM